MESTGAWKKIGIFVVVAISMVSLAACGGSDSDSSTSSETSESAASKTSESGSATTSKSSDGAQNQQQNQTQQTQQAQQQEQQQQQTQDQSPAFPTIVIVQCRISGTSGTLTVSASSTASGGNKGVTSVYVQTYNDENATVKTDLAWLGAETGNGDQWSTTRVAFGNGYKNKITVVAKSASGATKSAEFTGNGTPCPG